MRDRLPFINPTVDPGTPALLAPGRQPLGYGLLHDHLATLVARLKGLGLGRGQRVAYALPPGPEMAVASLAIVSACTGAPLNPAYTAEEFELYLGELEVQALLVMGGVESPARAAARSLGIRTFELLPQSGRPAGFLHYRRTQGGKTCRLLCG